MDCPAPTSSPPLDESDEPPTPLRSPSRLDFCMEDLEEGDDSPTHGMGWTSSSFHGDCPYTFIEDDPLVIDIAPLEYPHLLNVEGPKGDTPQVTNSHNHENTGALSSTFFADDEMDTIAIEPQAPIPVRPPSVQIQIDPQESMPPSRNATQRLNYPHRGFSRSALLQQKTFWSSRHEEWAEWQSRVERGEIQTQNSETKDAYTGLAIATPCATQNPPPYMRTPPSGLERDLVDHPPRKHEQDVHASIYPRIGDISALRDPYSVNIDRCFFKLPLWTLHKTLYAFHMEQRCASHAPSAFAYNATHVQSSMSSSTLSSYSPSTSGDDEESDSTLVADDSPVPENQHPPEPLKSTSSSHSIPSWNRFCGWELSWYARWELLIDLFRHDNTKYDTFTPIKLETPLESRKDPSSPPGRIFRFAVGEDEESSDDDEDYGTLVPDSSFNVDFDEECERAIAFYGREWNRSEVAL